MSKKLMVKKSFSFLIVLAFLLTCFTSYKNEINVKAGTYNVNGIFDAFDGAAIDDANWNVVDNEQNIISKTVQAGSIRVTDAPANSYFFTKEKYGENGKDLSVEFDVINYTGNGSMLFMMGVNGDISDTMADRANSYYQMGADNRSLFGGSFPFSEYSNDLGTTWLEANSWASIGITKNYRYQFYFYSNGEFKLSVKNLNENNAEFIEVIKNYGENVLENAKFTNVGNGRVGVWFDGVVPSLEIDNFAVTAVDGTDTSKDFFDDFESANLDISKWEVGNGVSGGSAYNMQFTNSEVISNAKMINKTKIVDFNSIEDVSAIISYDLSFANINNAKFTTVFGLEDSDNFDILSDKNFAINIIDDNDNVYLTAENTGIAVGLTNGTTTTATKIYIGTKSSFNKDVKIKYIITNRGVDSNIEVYADDILLHIFKYVESEGYIAFTTSIKAEGSISAAVDNFTTSYVKNNATINKDIYNDFSCAELSDDWYMSTPDESSMYIQDGKLIFNDGKTGCYFGTTEVYSNFDISFDISNISYENVFDDDNEIISRLSSFIGITFGREEIDSTYSSANMIYLDNNPWKGPSGYNEEAQNGRIISLLNGATGAISYDYANMFTEKASKRGAITIRMTAINGTVNVYVRYADEAYSILEQPIYTLTNINTTGYLALCCTEGAFYSIDNLYIKNLDQNGIYPEKEIIPPVVDEDDDEDDKEVPVVEKTTGCSNASTEPLALIALVIAGIAVIKFKR
jgi:hypothetical protein